jgi:hypothetical protein
MEIWSHFSSSLTASETVFHIQHRLMTPIAEFRLGNTMEVRTRTTIDDGDTKEYKHTNTQTEYRYLDYSTPLPQPAKAPLPATATPPVSRPHGFISPFSWLVHSRGIVLVDGECRHKIKYIDGHFTAVSKIPCLGNAGQPPHRNYQPLGTVRTRLATTNHKPRPLANTCRSARGASLQNHARGTWLQLPYVFPLDCRNPYSREILQGHRFQRAHHLGFD